MNRRFLLVAIAAACAGAGAGAGAYFRSKKFEPSKPKDNAVAQLMALTLNDSQGKAQKLSQWNGKFIVVNFWATWCGPCIQEMPELVTLQNDFAKDNVQLLGLGIDSPSNITEFAQKHQITYPLFSAGMEGTELSQQMGNKAGGLPFTVLISRDGTILQSYAGRLKIDEVRADIVRLNTPQK